MGMARWIGWDVPTVEEVVGLVFVHGHMARLSGCRLLLSACHRRINRLLTDGCIASHAVTVDAAV